jgi:hypothetical protein
MIVLFLLLSPALAQVEEFVDEASGLVIVVPELWDRDTSQEDETVRFVGVYDIARGKFVQFRITAGSADGFAADGWLESEKERASKFIVKATAPFTPDNSRTVGGLSAVGYTVGGTGKFGDGAEAEVRLRVYGVVNGSVFLQITELSVRGAHEQAGEAVDAMWDAISFRDPVGVGGGPGGIAPVEGETVEVVDQEGNYKLKLPPGWSVEREAPEDKDEWLRMVFARTLEDDDTSVCRVEMWRFTSGNATMFNVRTPSEVLEDLVMKGRRLFEPIYGEGSSGVIMPQTDEGVLLGGVAKSGAYEFRALTLEETEKVREAEALVARGEKGAKVPDWKPLVVRGRIALISPHVYCVRALFARSLSDHELLLAEYNALLDSLEFLQSEALPPPLAFAGERIGNTLDDPAFAKARKARALHEEKGPRNTHRLQYDFVVPPGFRYFDKKVGESISVVLLAQDKRNNWVRIIIENVSAKRAGEEGKTLGDKREIVATWKSNWESKARGNKMPRRSERFSLGRIPKGEGYKLLEGKVEKFQSTFTGLVSDKSSWRYIVTMETKGDGYKVFEDGITAFFKSIKTRKLR